MFIAAFESVDVIVIVAVVAILIFGSSKIPKIARGLGSAKSEFEKGLKEGQASSASTTTTTASPAPAPAEEQGTDTPSASS